MASCVRNTGTKNYQNPIIAFKVTVENVEGPSFLRHSVVLDDAVLLPPLLIFQI